MTREELKFSVRINMAEHAYFIIATCKSKSRPLAPWRIFLDEHEMQVQQILPAVAASPTAIGEAVLDVIQRAENTYLAQYERAELKIDIKV
jgi:hypothetical protein